MKSGTDSVQAEYHQRMADSLRTRPSGSPDWDALTPQRQGEIMQTRASQSEYHQAMAESLRAKSQGWEEKAYSMLDETFGGGSGTTLALLSIAALAGISASVQRRRGD